MKLVKDDCEADEIKILSAKDFEPIGCVTDDLVRNWQVLYSRPEISFRCQRQPLGSAFFFGIKDDMGKIHDISIEDVKQSEDGFIVRAERTCNCHFWQQ
ncbi:MAG: hypothetical protein ABSG87_10130 [Verrucomicrobiota bacterium]|jgi:hypothetical protein